MKIGIVGYGFVGSAIGRMVSVCADHELVVFDPYQAKFCDPSRRDCINSCDLVFLCVPTPSNDDGCDLSIVDECASWIKVPLSIKSTVIPGTIERLVAVTGNTNIAFSPEYLGESRFHPWREEGDCGFFIIGGPSLVFELSRSLYDSCLNRPLRYYHTRARTAELCKYMENCFLATKIAFVNQFFDIAEAMDVNFEELRELWIADPRIGESHTRVTAERGFRGRCLPKDVGALIAAMRVLGGAPLLEAVSDYNARLCASADAEHRNNSLISATRA
jgi:UDPglucose 6-dehydrogenase